MMNPVEALPDQIVEVLRLSDRALLAHEVAQRLGLDHAVVNRVLLGGSLTAIQDDSFRWRLPAATGTGARPNPPMRPAASVALRRPWLQARFPSKVSHEALSAFDRWVRAGRQGIAVTSTERSAAALLLLAVEDHLTLPRARAAIVTGDQPLLLARLLKVISADVHISGFSHGLVNGTVTVYMLGYETHRLEDEALAAERRGPILLALLGCRRVRAPIAVMHLVGPYRSRLAIDYPGPLRQSTRDLLGPVFGAPLADSVLQRETLTDLARPAEATPYSTAIQRELEALFGDDGQPSADPPEGTN
jgi:hypothetical protein